MLLTGTSTIISVVLGLWLGVRSGWRNGSLFDRVASGVSLTLWSVPTFWLGLILLVVFSVSARSPACFPAGGMTRPRRCNDGLVAQCSTSPSTSCCPA